MMRLFSTDTYITGAYALSPWSVGSIPPTAGDLGFQVPEPDYSELIDPRLIRRMSKVVRIGAAAGLGALRDAGISLPDAIITGTAYGCQADTEQFLRRMIEQEEQTLAPTAFIQSTHNTIGAQIALLIKCHAYNNTIVQRSASFEQALIDGLLLQSEGAAENILVGGVDEMSGVMHGLLARFGLFRKTGSAAGEGAAYFVLGKAASAQSQAQLYGVAVLPAHRTFEQNLEDFLSELGPESANIDTVLDGTPPGREIAIEPYSKYLPGAQVLPYKALCGDFPVAGSFAVWLAVQGYQGVALPFGNIRPFAGKTLVCHNFHDLSHTFVLLGPC